MHSWMHIYIQTLDTYRHATMHGGLHPWLYIHAHVFTKHTYIGALLHSKIPTCLTLSTYRPTYIPMYLHSCMPTYIQICLHDIPTHLPTYLPTYPPTYLLSYLHTCMHSYKHKYINTFRHTHIYIYTPIYIFLLLVHSKYCPQVGYSRILNFLVNHFAAM